MKYAMCVLAVALLSVACDARDTLKKSPPVQGADSCCLICDRLLPNVSIYVI